MNTSLIDLNSKEITQNTAELPELSREDALRVTEDLRHQLNSTYTTVIYAWQHRVWLTLGYDSWEEYLEVEIGEPELLSIPAKNREATIGAMVNAQMSARAISAATGLSKSTVNRTTQKARAEGLIDEDAQVLSRNGKKISATKPRSITEEIPQDLLDVPADELGIKTFTPKKNSKTTPDKSQASTPEPAENRDKATADAGLQQVTESAMDFEELARNVIDANGRQRFEAHLVTDQMVQHITRSVLTGAALLELFNLQPDLLEASELTADTLESAVGTLDRVLSALGR